MEKLINKWLKECQEGEISGSKDEISDYARGARLSYALAKKECANELRRHLTTKKCCVLCPQARKGGKCGINEDLEKVDEIQD